MYRPKVLKNKCRNGFGNQIFLFIVQTRFWFIDKALIKYFQPNILTLTHNRLLNSNSKPTRTIKGLMDYRNSDRQSCRIASNLKSIFQLKYCSLHNVQTETKPFISFPFKQIKLAKDD